MGKFRCTIPLSTLTEIIAVLSAHPVAERQRACNVWGKRSLHLALELYIGRQIGPRTMEESFIILLCASSWIIS
jgi:hypothetical protein